MQEIVIIGMGDTGTTAKDLLQAKFPDLMVVLVDDIRDLPDGNLIERAFNAGRARIRTEPQIKHGGGGFHAQGKKVWKYPDFNSFKRVPMTVKKP